MYVIERIDIKRRHDERWTAVIERYCCETETFADISLEGTSLGAVTAQILDLHVNGGGVLK